MLDREEFPRRPNDEPQSWESLSGGLYSPGFKTKVIFGIEAFAEVFGTNIQEKVMADIGGSGNLSLWYMWNAHKNNKKLLVPKIIDVELCPDDPINNERNLTIPFNIEDLVDLQKNSTRKALSQAAHFLGIDSSEVCDPQQLDVLLFSEILNYVDFSRVIPACLPYLKPGGSVAIINEPKRGIKSLLSPNGPTNNTDIINCLKNQGLHISEKKIFGDPEDQDLGLMALLAKKP